ncbi:MAG: response regulator transcription factor [Roseiflexaceae bacterium]
MSARILLIEDEPGLVLTLTDRLRAEGYTIKSATDGEQGLREASEQPHELVILDLMLPRKGGLDVCRELRQRGVATPVLMLTARDQVVDRVIGLKIGADDYLTKPFEMIELLARVEALLRRTPSAVQQQPDSYSFGTVRIDFKRTLVERDGQAVEMSALEFRLLRYFVTHRDVTLTRERLLNEVWGYNAMVSTRTVDVHIAWLRQKIEPNHRHPQYILTVHGIGYKFVG